MKISRQLQDNIRIIYRFHELYWHDDEAIGYCSRKRFRHLEKGDWREALGFFLQRYAFERNVAVPAYKAAAVRAIREGFAAKDKITQHKINDIYTIFVKLVEANGAKPLEKLWPLNPDRSVLRLCSTIDSYNIVSWTKNLLLQGKAEEAAEKLLKIRGIGEKITCLWLRDVADAFYLSLDKLDEAYHLQPIDTWIDKFVKAISATSPHLNHKYAADAMVEIANQCKLERHTLLNTAVWVFSANIMSDSDEDLADLIANAKRFKSFMLSFKKWCQLAISCQP